MAIKNVNKSLTTTDVISVQEWDFIKKNVSYNYLRFLDLCAVRHLSSVIEVVSNKVSMVTSQRKFV